MAAFESIDITSPAFQLRLANLLVATRTRRGQGVGAMAKASGGRFGKGELKAFEAGETPLDESTIDELAALYQCDLGVILPMRLPVVISANRISAGGVHEDFDNSDPQALLSAYLTLVRTLRRQKRAPVVDLRRDDVEVLAGFMKAPNETVVHQLATLMHATQTKRTAMVGVLATGAVVVGLVGSVAAVGVNESSPPPDPTQTTSVESTVQGSTTETTLVETTSTSSTSTTVVDTTVVETTVAPTAPATVAPTVAPPPPVTTTPPPPTTAKPVVTTTTVEMIDTDLTTVPPDVSTGGPPIP
jgi:hypothetical protein